MKKLTCSLMLALVGGCATGYHNTGFTGGFRETEISENVYKISFEGNGYTSKKRARDLALLRAADLTMQKNFKYFAIVGNYNQVDRSYTTISDTTYTIDKPSADNMIIMLNERPQNEVVFEAQVICKTIGEKYGTTCGKKGSK